MSIFSRKVTVVRVVSGHPSYPVRTPDPRDRFQGYEYTWTLPTPPQIGTWVIVPGDNKPWVAGIVSVTTIGKTQAARLKPVIRIATPDDIEADIRRRRRS